MGNPLCLDNIPGFLQYQPYLHIQSKCKLLIKIRPKKQRPQNSACTCNSIIALYHFLNESVSTGHWPPPHNLIKLGRRQERHKDVTSEQTRSVSVLCRVAPSTARDKLLFSEQLEEKHTYKINHIWICAVCAAFNSLM